MYVGLRVTALWSFLLFWPAYAGSATATLFGPRFAGLARRGRDFGLSFAAALAVHVGLVLWLYRVATENVGVMAFFWVGVLCTCLLTLFSLPQLRAALGPHLWRLFCTAVLEYTALAFAEDFIFIPLGGGFDKYPLTSLPFAVTLVGGTGLRLAAFLRRMTERRAYRPALLTARLCFGSGQLWRASLFWQRCPVPRVDRSHLPSSECMRPPASNTTSPTVIDG